MDIYERQYPLFSACGLNCGLCPRFHTDGVSKCPGCGGKGFFSSHPSCGVISCNQRHDNIEHCFECGEYPCKKIENAHCVDSFITHRNMQKDIQKAKENGLEAYRLELAEKVLILERLLDKYNDGRKKSFYCLAVNLLELADVKAVMAQIEAETPEEGLTEKEKAGFATKLFQSMADKRNIELKLNKKH